VFRRITEPSPVRVVSVFLEKVDHIPRLPYSPVWYPGRENVTLSRRPLACVNVPKFLKVLDKKKGGILFHLFIGTMSVALRVDDIPLSQGLPDTGEYHSLQYAE